MKTITLGLILVIVFSSGIKPTTSQQFDNFRGNFIKGYDALHLHEQKLSYAENLKQIQAPADIQKQKDFFEQVKKQLAFFSGQYLNEQQEADFQILLYETELNLERLQLEKKWINRKPSVIPDNNLYSIPCGQEWYVYFLRSWIGAEVNPDEIYLNGMEEIERVKNHIDSIRIKTGMDDSTFDAYLNRPEFFVQDEKQVQQAFEETKTRVLRHMPRLFNVRQVPELMIRRGSNESLVQTPGYYDSNTFYYNLFDSSYNKRQIGWLFLHEAIPGHHYQASIAARSDSSPVHQMFHFPGFSEGWAAYVEQYGMELGAYTTVYDELGKWEWDLVRSVRVPLDVGINYYGWSDEKALAFWKQYIPNQHAIALREINRIKKWPAQVITYKYGAMQIMQWKRKLMEEQGDKFDIKNFHDRLLMQGDLPFKMVKANVFRKKK